MKMQDINLLFEYNRWANMRILEAVSQLNTDQFAQEIKSSYPSVRNTLVHIMSAEWIWLMRWNGSSPRSMLNHEDFSTLYSLRARWSEIEKESIRFLATLADESLEKEISYLNTEGKQFKYKLWQMMQHMVNHSSYHRGQITMMLRQIGAPPISTDLIVFHGVKTGQIK